MAKNCAEAGEARIASASAAIARTVELSSFCFVRFKRLMRPATTYSPNAELGVSTIGPDRLNGRVRNGNGCIPVGNITGLTNLLNRIRPLRARRESGCLRIVPDGSEANSINEILAKKRQNKQAPYSRARSSKTI